MVRVARGATDSVLWHDVECGGYEADLGLWAGLARACDGPLLELGCGTGRVALRLAAAGHDVTGLDCDPDLVAALADRARRRGQRVRAEVGDARSFELGRDFALAIAPMQVVQLLEGARGRRAMLGCVRRHLRPGGRLALALADPFDGVSAADSLPPLPDMREEEGWLYSSNPVAVREEEAEGERVAAIDRLRQAVAPGGELAEAVATIRLELFGAEELEEAARDAGFEVLPRQSVPATDSYVGSTVVVLEAA